jgi:hypothetical protein
MLNRKLIISLFCLVVAVCLASSNGMLVQESTEVVDEENKIEEDDAPFKFVVQPRKLGYVLLYFWFCLNEYDV